MKDQSTRRFFIRNTIMATVGFSVLPSLHLNATAQKELNSASLKSDVGIGGLSEKKLVVKGKIYDKTGTFARSNASIEVWHLSPHTKRYEYCKNIIPNTLGEYQFTTDFPEKEFGKLPRVHFKVVTKERSYKTELIVSDFGAYISDRHWELNKQLGDSVFPDFSQSKNISKIVFNLSV
jgi:hypothetical protein